MRRPGGSVALNYSGRCALITGGSRGIGYALAERLVDRGASVVVLARDEEGLRRAAEGLRAIAEKRGSDGEHVSYLACDVTDEGRLEKKLARLFSERGAPDLVVNGAGAAHPGLFVELDSSVFRWMMELNYFGTVNVTRAVVPAMVARGSGHVVNVSSVAGFLGVFGYTAYGASKFAVAGFSDALRVELKPHGVKVSLVYPPDTDTDGFRCENELKPFVTHEISGGGKAMPPGSVADTILRDVARGRYLITPGVESTVFFRLSRVLGGLVYPLMDHLVARAARKETGTDTCMS